MRIPAGKSSATGGRGTKRRKGRASVSKGEGRRRKEENDYSRECREFASRLPASAISAAPFSEKAAAASRNHFFSKLNCFAREIFRRTWPIMPENLANTIERARAFAAVASSVPPPCAYGDWRSRGENVVGNRRHSALARTYKVRSRDHGQLFRHRRSVQSSVCPRDPLSRLSVSRSSTRRYTS